MLRNRTAAESLKPPGKSQANHEKMPIKKIHKEDYMSCTDISTKAKKSKKQNFHPSSSARQGHGSGEGTEKSTTDSSTSGNDLLCVPSTVRKKYATTKH